MFDTALTMADLGFLAQGAAMTLAVTVVSVIAGTVLGIVFGVIRNQAGPYWSMPITFLLDIFRSVPLLIQLVLGNAAQSILKLGWAPFTTSCVVLSLYTAAYCTEIVRGGIASVPATNQMVWAILMTSLGVTVGMNTDLAGVTQALNAVPFRTFEFFALAAVIYYVIAKAVTLAARLAATRMFRY